MRAEAKAQPGRYGRIETDEFGSTQIRALEPRAKLEIEVGDNSFGVTFTSQTPGRLRYELRRRPLSLDCRFDAPWDGGDLGVLDLNWRDDYDDWGLALLDYPPDAPSLATVVRCAERRAGRRPTRRLRCRFQPGRVPLMPFSAQRSG